MNATRTARILFLATSVATVLLAPAVLAPGGSPAAWTGLLALLGVGLALARPPRPVETA